VAGDFGFGLLNLLLLLPGIGLGVLLWQVDHAAGVIVGVVYALILAVVTSAVKGVFTAALYCYATSGQAPRGFTMDLIQGSLTRGRPRAWQ
jgi:predicted membrane protein